MSHKNLAVWLSNQKDIKWRTCEKILSAIKDYPAPGACFIDGDAALFWNTQDIYLEITVDNDHEISWFLYDKQKDTYKSGRI